MARKGKQKSVGRLFIDVALRQGNMRKNLQTLNRTLGKELTAMGKKAAMAFTAGFAAISYKVTRDLINIDQLDKAAGSVGMLTSEYQALALASKLAGTDANAAGKAMFVMSRNLSDLSVTSKQAQDAIKRLGLSTSDLIKLPVTEQFRRISAEIFKLPTYADRAAAAQNIFGKSAKALMPLMAGAGKAIGDARDQISKFGGTITEEGAAKVVVFNDQMTLLRERLSALTMSMSVNVVPVLGGFFNMMLDGMFGTGKSMEDTDKIWKNFADNVIYGIGVMGDAAQGLKMIWVGINLMFNKALRSVIADLKPVVKLIDNLIANYNYLMGWVGGKKLNLKLMDSFEGVVLAGITDQINELEKELSSLANNPASDKLVAKWEKAKKEIDVAVQKQIEFRRGMNVDIGDDTVPDQAGEKFKELAATVTEAMTTADMMVEHTAQSIEDSLMQMLHNGKFSVRQLITSIVSEFMRLAIIRPIAQGLASFTGPIFGALLGGLGGGAAGGALQTSANPGFVGSSFYSHIPGMAAGGPIYAGQPTIVGEEGPEMILPNRSGLVVPNHMLGGMGGPQITVSQSFAPGITVQQLAMAAERIKAETVSAISDAMTRAGSFRQLMQA